MKPLASSLVALFAVGTMFVAGCHTEPKSEAQRAGLQEDATKALDQMKLQDPSLDQFMKNPPAYAYAIFPDIGKGGLVVGGAYGHGLVFQNGQQIGWSDVTQANIGLQAGGQEYSELILFQTPDALHQFQSGHFAFSADASAVALRSGAAATANYRNGIATFTMPKGGLMFEASIGGQSFTYQPINGSSSTTQPSY